MELRFALLGALETTVDGSDLILASAMMRGVLAVLLLAGGQRVTIDRLSQALWSTPPRSAASNLRSYLARLRVSLRDGHPDLATRLITMGHEGGYRFILNHHELDSRLFADLARRGRDHLLNGDYALADATLREALSLWRGPAGQDLAAAGTLGQQLTHLNEQRVVAIEDLVDARLALGATTDLLADTRALVLEHPLRDRPWEQLMRTLYLAGDPAGALNAYQQARRSFNEALGMEPASRLQKLQTAILRRDEHAIQSTAMTLLGRT
ncbi:AfsR/SARP family transcriptional regulator [Micromonospora sp. NPDC004704]